MYDATTTTLLSSSDLASYLSPQSSHALVPRACRRSLRSPAGVSSRTAPETGGKHQASITAHAASHTDWAGMISDFTRTMMMISFIIPNFYVGSSNKKPRYTYTAIRHGSDGMAWWRPAAVAYLYHRKVRTIRASMYTL